MKPPFIKFLTWSTCSVVIAIAAVAMTGLLNPESAAAEALVVPEPALLALLGVGLTALALRVRASRRP